MEYLIPSEWFEGLHWALLLLITAVAVAVLVKGADRLVEGASGLAYRLHVPKVIVGATIVSLGTTSPEAAVSVVAAWSGNPGLALGNAVGSIIADSGLIFGLACLLAVLPADRFVLNRQGWVQFGSASLLALLCYVLWAAQSDNAALDRSVGLLLLVLLGLYMFVSVRWARRHPQGAPSIVPADVNGADGAVSAPASPSSDGPSVARLLGMVVIGLVLVVFGSHVLVSAVSELATQWGVPQVVIAATLVALGTSLPELVTAIVAIRKRHPELVVGNVIGADILNVLFVVGASAAAAPLPIVEKTAKLPAVFLLIHLPAMLLILLLFRVFIFAAVRKGSFSRWFGAPLLAIWLAFVVITYVLS